MNLRGYAEKTFLVELVLPHVRNAKKETTKAPVPYLLDLGLRNHALGLVGNLENPKELGFAFENLVHLLLKARAASSARRVRFWRTRDKAEVDFVLEDGLKAVPVEVKHGSLKGERVPRALRSFVERYEPPEAYLVNLDHDATTRIGTARVSFLPYHRLVGEAAVP